MRTSKSGTEYSPVSLPLPLSLSVSVSASVSGSASKGSQMEPQAKRKMRASKKREANNGVDNATCQRWPK
ncbi:hypothetical protein AWZ03_007819 [Drosophila navojoa]|uniref:Uncharacterized protein n=1 Tax=Drosophila navojoa TaxID=7232 RepID=A0A484BDD3_DRONA|nr:hypothetical protein AWZ03_007819 [Drosophila navojoa]